MKQHKRGLFLTLAGLLTVVIAGAATVPAHGSALTGSAGIDTSIAPTDSAVTVPGRGDFSGMKFSVNQTKNLVNQAVSVTWTGGKQTIGPGQFGANYVQILLSRFSLIRANPTRTERSDSGSVHPAVTFCAACRYPAGSSSAL